MFYCIFCISCFVLHVLCDLFEYFFVLYVFYNCVFSYICVLYLLFLLILSFLGSRWTVIWDLITWWVPMCLTGSIKYYFIIIHLRFGVLPSEGHYCYLRHISPYVLQLICTTTAVLTIWCPSELFKMNCYTNFTTWWNFTTWLVSRCFTVMGFCHLRAFIVSCGIFPYM